MTIPERGGPEAADSLKMIEYFSFCTLVELNVFTKHSSISKSGNFDFCQRQFTAIVTRSYCLFKTMKDRGGLEVVDSGNKRRPFGFCTLVEENVITMVFYDFKEWKLCFLPKTIKLKCDRRLLSC